MIFIRGKVRRIGKLNCDLYLLVNNQDREAIAVTKTSTKDDVDKFLDEVDLWHRRLGYDSSNAL